MRGTSVATGEDDGRASASRRRGDDDARRWGWGRIAAVTTGAVFVACGTTVAVSVVQQLGGVRQTASIIHGHYVYARVKAGAYGVAADDARLGAADLNLTIDRASLGGCDVSSGGSPPQYCAVPQVAVRTCDYTSSCLIVPVCDFGDVPVGGQSVCETTRVCAPQVCAPRVCTPRTCCRVNWKGKCTRRCGGSCIGGGCTPGACKDVAFKWRFTCRRARSVTTGKCDACSPFFVSREDDTQCVVDPSLTAAYDAAVAAVNTAKNAIEDTMDDIDTLVSDLTTTLPNKANEITSTITSTITGIPGLVDDVVSDLIKEAFPSDAKQVLSQISSVFSSASLGQAPTGSGKHDHFGYVLNQERVRKLLRNKLRGTTEHIPEYTTIRESASLGGAYTISVAEISLPLDEILPESVVDLSYDMPWPEKLGDSPFSPTAIRGGFPEPSWAMGFEIRDFTFPEAVATDILTAFFGFFEPLFESIGDGVINIANDAKSSVMSPIDSLNGVVSNAKTSANSVKNSLNSATNALNGRKLLSDEEAQSHYEHLRDLHTQTKAHISLIEQQHDMLLDRIENHVMLQVAKVRTALAEDPWLEQPGTIAQFEHLRARLGGPLEDGTNAAKTKLVNAMKSLKDFSMTAVLYMTMRIEFAVEAEAEAFRAGDVLDLLSGVPRSAFLQGEFPIPMTPFTMKMSMAAGVSIPYFLMAKASGVFSYTAELSGMEVGITVSNGAINAVLPEPRVTLTPFLEANLEAHAQLGVVTQVTEMTTQLCVAGMVCSGPKATAEQRVYFGTDMAAQATTEEAGCAAMQAEFNDNFVYSDSYIDSKCTYANIAGVKFAIGLGAYVQIPKTDLNIVLKTDVDIAGLSICVDDVQLYTWPPEPGNFYLKML